MSLLAKLIAAGTPAELVEEVAMLLAEKRLSERAIEQRRINDRERSARRRHVQSRDDTGQPMTTRDVTDEPSLSRPPNENNSNPPTHTHPDGTSRPRKARPAKPKPDSGLPWHGVPDWLPLDPWHRFLKARQSARRQVDSHAAELLIAKLQRLAEDGHPPGDVLDQSTLNGWTGIFPLDHRKSRNGQSTRNDEIRDPIAAVVAERQAARAAAERGEPGGWTEGCGGTA